MDRAAGRAGRARENPPFLLASNFVEWPVFSTNIPSFKLDCIIRFWNRFAKELPNIYLKFFKSVENRL